MDAFVELSWRAYPGAILLAVGLALHVLGWRGLLSSFRMSAWDGERPIVFLSGFRVGVIGAALATLAAAWIWQQLWLLLLALAIGGEELLETSVLLYTLRRGRRIQATASGGAS
jgi:hypothetical protein